MATAQWWVISYNPLGQPPTFEYLDGTKAAAEAKAALAVDGSVTGPFATEADARAAAAAGHVTPPDTDTAPGIPDPVSGITTAAEAVPHFLSQISSRAFIARAAKVIIGMALVVIGVLQLTHASQLVKPAAEAAVLA